MMSTEPQAPSQDEREADCLRSGHPGFDVVTKQFARSAFRGNPTHVRCVWCHRTWPVITKDSWIPAKYRNPETNGEDR